MHLNKRDNYNTSYAKLPYWEIATGIFVVGMIIIIIKSILRASARKRQQNTEMPGNRLPIYNPQNDYYQQPSTTNPPRNQPVNSEYVIEPLPIYTPPNNTMEKPPTYYRN